MNKYLVFIPIERSTGVKKTQKAYGKTFPYDEIRSITRQAIPEWTSNLLALGKEPWRFKYVDDQLDMHRHKWQANQQKQIIVKMAGKMPGKSNNGKIKNNE
jgi:hypothetical protein